MLVINVGTLGVGALKLRIGGDIANKLLIIFAIFPSSSLGNIIKKRWGPSKSNNQTLSAFRRKVLILLSNDWNEDIASELTISSFPFKLHLVLMDWSASELDGAVQPFVEVSIGPWRVDELLLLEFVDRLS